MDIKIQADIVYDRNHDLTLDVYEPAEMNGFGLMVIHGGGWFHGDKSKDRDWAEMLAGAGYLVIAPNYRLAPDHLFPAARDDIFMAYDWLKNSRYNLRGLGAAGGSSGGNLAIELGLKKGLPIVSLSGIIDLDEWVAGHQEVTPIKSDQDFMLKSSDQIDQAGPDDSFYKWFVLNYVGGDPVKLREASLLHRIDSTAGPMLLVNSINELSPNRPVIELQEKLLAAGVPVMTKFIPGGRHAKGYLAEAMPYTLDFFKEFLKS